jgi:hypothetical protein
VGERGGDGRREGPPRARPAPSGGSDPHEVGERGGFDSFDVLDLKLEMSSKLLIFMDIAP